MLLDIVDKHVIVIVSVKDDRLDAYNSEELRTRMRQLMDEGRSNLLIDLSEVRFLDSSGLGTLVAGFKQAEARSGRLKLTGLQPQVRSMFELTRLHKIFEIFETIEEAEGSFSAG